MNHVSVSSTDGNWPTQGQKKTMIRVGIEPTTFRREQVVGTEDVKVTAMNTYRYKEGLPFLQTIAV